MAAELRRQRIYVTNLVKCAQPHPEVPAQSAIREDFPLLTEEIALVNPAVIVSFGQLVFQTLTRKPIKLHSSLESLRVTGRLPVSCFNVGDRKVPIVPSFFPIGRGNPQLAVEILKSIRDAAPATLAASL